MTAIEIIDHDIPSLKWSDSGLIALSLLEEYKVSELPLINDQKYVGLITEDLLLDFELIEGELKNLKNELIKPFVHHDDHFYEVIRLMCEEKLSLVPVVDDHEILVGSVTASSLVHRINVIESLSTPGGIIQLELNIHDYSLSEIARIVESNNAKILNLYVSSQADSKKLRVTLKVNLTDLNPIIQTFNRFNYSVSGSFYQDPYNEDMRKRFDGLMRYLNI